MTRSIDRDMQRFKDIVRGRVRENLKHYVNHGEMLGRKGRELVSIPVPSIDVPHFRHGKKGSGGVGQGKGEQGDAVGRGQQPGDGTGQAGDQPGAHIREVEISLDELAAMLGEELELPRIEPRGKESLQSRKDKYSGIRRSGPDSLRHLKRTYKQALKRQIALNHYDPQRPIVVPNRDDERYRSWNTISEPQSNAAIIYVMDVSGSMTDDQKEIVRIESFWIDLWLRKNYRGLQRRYVVHDAVAHEVDEDTFYRTRESGGTRISSAYKMVDQIIQREFPPTDWNIYCFQFSDGDNWGDDNIECLNILTERILPLCNLFCYGQVESPYGSGDFIRELRKLQDSREQMILSEIANKAGIHASIKAFLGTGR